MRLLPLFLLFGLAIASTFRTDVPGTYQIAHGSPSCPATLSVDRGAVINFTSSGCETKPMTVMNWQETQGNQLTQHFINHSTDVKKKDTPNRHFGVFIVGQLEAPIECGDLKIPQGEFVNFFAPEHNSSLNFKEVFSRPMPKPSRPGHGDSHGGGSHGDSHGAGDSHSHGAGDSHSHGAGDSHSHGAGHGGHGEEKKTGDASHSHGTGHSSNHADSHSKPVAAPGATPKPHSGTEGEHSAANKTAHTDAHGEKEGHGDHGDHQHSERFAKEFYEFAPTVTPDVELPIMPVDEVGPTTTPCPHGHCKTKKGHEHAMHGSGMSHESSDDEFDIDLSISHSTEHVVEKKASSSNKHHAKNTGHHSRPTHDSEDHEGKSANITHEHSKPHGEKTVHSDHSHNDSKPSHGMGKNTTAHHDASEKSHASHKESHTSNHGTAHHNGKKSTKHHSSKGDAHHDGKKATEHHSSTGDAHHVDKKMTEHHSSKEDAHHGDKKATEHHSSTGDAHHGDKKVTDHHSSKRNAHHGGKKATGHHSSTGGKGHEGAEHTHGKEKHHNKKSSHSSASHEDHDIDSHLLEEGLHGSEEHEHGTEHVGEHKNDAHVADKPHNSGGDAPHSKDSGHHGKDNAHSKHSATHEDSSHKEHSGDSHGVAKEGSHGHHEKKTNGAPHAEHAEDKPSHTGHDHSATEDVKHSNENASHTATEHEHGEHKAGEKAAHAHGKTEGENHAAHASDTHSATKGLHRHGKTHSGKGSHGHSGHGSDHDMEESAAPWVTPEPHGGHDHSDSHGGHDHSHSHGEHSDSHAGHSDSHADHSDSHADHSHHGSSPAVSTTPVPHTKESHSASHGDTPLQSKPSVSSVIGLTVTGDKFVVAGGKQYLALSDQCLYVQTKKMSCFPSGTMVTLEGGKRTPIEELKIGDMVSVGNGKYSRVFMWTHRDANSKATYLRLTTTSGHSLTAAVGHYIHTSRGMLSVEEVTKGDDVVLENGRLSQVMKIEIDTQAKGLYNPQTLAGDIVVDGILASTYTKAVTPKMAHAALAPLRMMYEIGVSLLGRSEGYGTWMGRIEL